MNMTENLTFTFSIYLIEIVRLLLNMGLNREFSLVLKA